MKLSKFIYLPFFILTFIFVSSSAAYADHDNATTADSNGCYDTPIPGGASNPDMNRIKNEVLAPNNLPISTSKGTINVNYLYKRHMVVYGDPQSVPGNEVDKTKKLCGLTIYRYAGYTTDGRVYTESKFRNDAGGSVDHVQKHQIVRFPWNNSAIKNKSNNTTYFPYPTRDSFYGSKAERTAHLDRVLDEFAPPTMNGGHGYFREKHKIWCLDASDQLYVSTNCGTKGVIFTGKYLYDFAIIQAKPTNFSPGMALFYTYDTTCISNYCYFLQPIAALSDPFDNSAKHDALVDLSLTKTTFTDEKVKGTILIKNDFAPSKPASIASPCDTTNVASKAQCKNSSRYAVIVVKNKADSSELLRKNFNYAAIAQGKTGTISLDTFNILPTKSGSYEIEVSIPHYKDKDGIEETSFLNNSIKKSFNFTVSQNASISVSGSTNYVSTDILTNKIKVYNNTISPLSGPLTINILKENGSILKTLPNKTFSNIVVNGSYTYDISSDLVTLEPGNYKIQAKIKHYTSLPETTYTDNTAEFAIEVKPFVPANTKCQAIESQYIEVTSFNGADSDLTRACIGWAPNYPSTTIEGGQGTYFYVAYKLFPTPLPAYKVTTHDTLGLNQTLELLEPNNKLGACNLKVTNDTECNLYEPFIYYPAKWESRFSTSQYQDFRGPYTAGPHDFHHYTYRGRMMPKSVTFNFSILDMKDNANIPLANGSLIYDVPDECYQTDVIDITEECRLVQFYVPTDGLTANLSLPDDKNANGIPTDKIKFFNPGEHRFRIDIEEKQIYLYQKDNGAEWQGKAGINRSPWKTEPATSKPTDPVKTNTVSGTSPVTWQIQDSYKNQCYSEEDAFGDTGTWNESTNKFTENNNSANICEHNHSKDFHYWRFDWSAIKKFGNSGYIN